jgi:hypothetical protein
MTAHALINLALTVAISTPVALPSHAEVMVSTSLVSKLYPPAGVYRQIAQLFDYSYGIDQNKPDQIRN